MVALRFADGWYNDDLEGKPHYEGWRRVLSLDGGKMSFHIPDNFPVGNLKQIKPDWDGHTTREKWLRVLRLKEIETIDG